MYRRLPSANGGCSTLPQPMKAKEIRDLTTQEIQQRIADARQALQNVRFQHAIASVEDTAVLKHQRREIARLQTILRERAAN